MKYLLMTAFTACMLSACSGPQGPDDSNLSQPNAIQNRDIDIVADTDTAYTDRTITITTRCVPLVRCRGTVSVAGNGEWHNDNGWILQWPYHDTLMAPETPERDVAIDIELFPGAPAEQQWQIRLLPQGPKGKGRYAFSAHIAIDSVYVSDSSRYFSIGSREVLRASPDGRGYASFAVSGTGWVFHAE